MSKTITRIALASIQVCVPKETTDEEVISFANKEHPTGLDFNWAIRREGDELLRGDPERVPCGTYPDHVHMMLDC